MLKLKRAYEPANADDGYRVLVERLWPRGLKKQTAKLDAWRKELAPSDALRRWYGHAAERWTEFTRRYRRELESDAARALLAELATRAQRSVVTLVFSTHDASLSNARVLEDEIGRLRTRPAKAGAGERRVAEKPRGASPSGAVKSRSPAPKSRAHSPKSRPKFTARPRPRASSKQR